MTILTIVNAMKKENLELRLIKGELMTLNAIFGLVIVFAVAFLGLILSD